MYVCLCNAVTDTQIRDAARRGARSLADLNSQLRVASCCGRCADCANRILDECLGGESAGSEFGLACA